VKERLKKKREYTFGEAAYCPHWNITLVRASDRLLNDAQKLKASSSLPCPW
jgi:hypothetical protein